jgi:hypothetical protein
VNIPAQAKTGLEWTTRPAVPSFPERGIRKERKRGSREKIGDPVQAETKVLRDMENIVLKMRGLSSQDVKDMRHGFARLAKIRSSISEDLNQIQHECLILQGLRWLLENGFGPETAWEWNPRQTGPGDEPDLRGTLNGRIVVSAEATSSTEPKGILDSRMRDTLRKLSTMQGEKCYFVCADAMEQRARTKIAKAGWSIQVIRV